MASLPRIQNDAIVTPSNVSSDGGARAAASAYSSIARAAENIAGAIARNETRQGAKEAQDAFNSAAASTPAGDRVAVPERKGGLLDRLGVKAASYENTLRLLSLQRAEHDARLRLAELQAEHQARPEAFEAAARGWAEGYLEGAPGEDAPAINKMFGDLISEGVSRSVIDRESLDRQEARQGMDAKIQGVQDELDDMLDDAGLDAFADPLFQSKQAELVDLLDIKANDPTFVYSGDQRDLDKNRIADAMQLRAAGVTVADEVREAFDFGGARAAIKKLDDILASDELADLNKSDAKKIRLAGERVIEEREREIKSAIAERNRELSEYHTSNYQDLLIGVIKSTRGLSDIESFYADGKISKGHYVALLQQVSKADRDADDLIAAQDLLSSDTPLNPADADHRKAVDLVFNKHGGADLIKEDPDGGLDAALAFTTTYGIIPKAAVTTLKGRVANGTAEQQGQALDSVSRLLEEAPAATRAAFSDAEIAEATYYSDLVAVGAPAEFAINSVMKARDAKFDGAAKARREAGRKLAIDAVTRQDTMVALGLGKKSGDERVFGGVEAIDAAERSYRTLFVEHYASHGDAARAKKQAGEVLKKHFGKTSVTGVDRVMPYPPEAFYAVPGSDQKWMGRQLQMDVKAALGEDVPLKSIQLISDRQTAAEAQSGFSPTYKVVVTRADGALEAVDARFAFDPGPAELGVFLDNAYEVEKAERRRVRDAYLETQPITFAGGSFSAEDRKKQRDARIARRKELERRKDDPRFQAGELDPTLGAF